MCVANVTTRSTFSVNTTSQSASFSQKKSQQFSLFKNLGMLFRHATTSSGSRLEADKSFMQNGDSSEMNLSVFCNFQPL